MEENWRKHHRMSRELKEITERMTASELEDFITGAMPREKRQEFIEWKKTNK